MEDLNYFNYLKMRSHSSSYFLRTAPTINGNIFYFPSYYSKCLFKEKICEHVYNAINMFPNIKQFDIVCKNQTATTKISIGLFDEIADDGLRCMAKVIDLDDEEAITLNRTDIKNLYSYNRDPHANTYDVEIFMLMLSRGDEFPEVTCYVDGGSFELTY